MDPVKKPRASHAAVRGGDDVGVPVNGSPEAATAADELADEAAAMLLRQPEAPRAVPLSVKLSHQLHTKLLRTARDEGVDLDGLVQELLAEGVTLRAWEIIERKSAMRGQAQAPNQPVAGGNRPFNGNSYNQQRPSSGGNNRGANGSGGVNGNRNQGGRSGGARPPVANNAWMEDKAAFLEYVRSQEKRRR
ncbi:MAG: hypothetical protein NTZ90_11945 [Proteobacteria bacterium]|nr:hypothetical protein [Pseudomonadota bacterium]